MCQHKNGKAQQLYGKINIISNTKLSTFNTRSRTDQHVAKSEAIVFINTLLVILVPKHNSKTSTHPKTYKKLLESYPMVHQQIIYLKDKVLLHDSKKPKQN